MKMMRCDPRAFARCPYKKECSDSAEHTSFYEGTECDYFNQRVIRAPLTNADKFRAKSDEELAELIVSWGICSDVCSQKYCDNPFHNKHQENCKKRALTWLQRPAEGEF